jgi:hypothetical protein
VFSTFKHLTNEAIGPEPKKKLLNVDAHTIIRSKFRSFKETLGLMNKPELAFVGTSS